MASAGAPAQAGAQTPLTLELEGKRHQQAERLRAVATCSVACELRLHAFGETPNGRFGSRNTNVSLAAGVATTVRISFRRAVLHRIEDETGRARLMAKATAADENARASLRVRLKP